MSAGCSETTHLFLGGGNVSVNTMADTSRVEEEFFKKHSEWGRFTKKYHRYPCLVFTIYLAFLLILYLSFMIVGVWALLKALIYFPITTQPATTMIIISAVIIMMTVVMVLANIIGIIACRFGAASTEFCSTHRLVYYLGYLVALVVISLLSVLGIVTLVLMITYLPDANAHSTKSSFDNYLINQTIQETWDMAQEDLKCCGLLSFTDYKNLFNNLSVPVSCCNTTHPLVNQSTCPEIVTNATLAKQISQIYTEGCVSHLESFYQYIFTVVGWYYTSWGILLVIPVIALCFWGINYLCHII